MEFREQIIEYRKESPSISGLSAKTDTFFLKKYGRKEKGGTLQFNGSLIPGNIYFFSYETDSKVSEKIKFVNRNPLILYISSERVGNETIVKSIDLTITPPEKRLEILQNFWNQFSSIIQSNERMVGRGMDPEPIRLESKDLIKLFSGTGYNFSFTGFKYKYMTDIKVIDYSDWCKLPYLKYSFILGPSINEIYNDYRSKLKE